MTCLSTGSGVVNDSLLDRKSNKPGETSITLDLDNDLVLSQNHSHLHKRLHEDWVSSWILWQLPMLSTAPAHPAEHVVPQDPSKRPCSWHAPSTFVPRMFNSEKRIVPCFHGFPAENLKLDPCLNGRKSTTITYSFALRSFSISPWVSRAFSTAKAPLPRIATFWPADLWSGTVVETWEIPWAMAGYNGCKVGVWNGSVTPKKKCPPCFWGLHDMLAAKSTASDHQTLWAAPEKKRLNWWLFPSNSG